MTNSENNVTENVTHTRGQASIVKQSNEIRSHKAPSPNKQKRYGRTKRHLQTNKRETVAQSAISKQTKESRARKMRLLPCKQKLVTSVQRDQPTLCIQTKVSHERAKCAFCRAFKVSHEHATAVHSKLVTSTQHASYAVQINCQSRIDVHLQTNTQTRHGASRHLQTNTQGYALKRAMMPLT